MTPLSSRSPEDVSKEELLEILAKMNKRVKALNGARVQLQEKCAKVEHDNFRLMSLLKEEVLTEADMIDATNQLQIQNTKGAYDIFTVLWADNCFCSCIPSLVVLS